MGHYLQPTSSRYDRIAAFLQKLEPVHQFLINICLIIDFPGNYLPNSIIVQLDDKTRPDLGTYSGLYFLGKTKGLDLFTKRAKYFGQRGEAIFGYCKKESRWTLSFGGENPCEDILIKSPMTESYDILRSLGSENAWLVSEASDASRFFPMEDFSMTIGCISDGDCGEGKGVCRQDRCVCNEGFYGFRCDFGVSPEQTCTNLEVDEQTGIFRGSREFADKFELLRGPDGKFVIVYEHPVYTSEEASGGALDLLLFTGLRWALVHTASSFPNAEVNSKEALAKYFLDNPRFLATESLGNIEFLSEPVRFNTPSDTATPNGKRWDMVRAGTMDTTEYTGDSEAVLLCALCNNSTNPCQNGNSCSANGRCACDNGAEGTLCHVTPLSNGRCDVYFNQALFNYGKS